MPQQTFEESKWVYNLALALEDLANSVTASRINLPTLTNEAYRALANAAAHNDEARLLFDEYLVNINSDPTKVIEFFRKHPVIRCELTNFKDQDAVMMVTPTGMFRVEWERLASHLAKSTIKQNGEYAAQILHEYLILGDDNNLPGYEIVLLHGLEIDKRTNVGPGIFLAPYDEIVALGLISAPRERVPWDNFPDYSAMNTIAFVRKLKWGPGITSTKTSRNIMSASKVTFSYLETQEDLRVGLDLLSVVAHHGIDLLAGLCRGEKFMEDLDPNFQQCPPMSFRSNYLRSRKTLTKQDVDKFQESLQNWVEFRGDRSVPSLAIGRLAASVSRQGRFGLQDSILDISIALEIMYQIGNMELSYKLAVRAAHFLGENSEKRNDIFREIKTLYTARSSIVHGKKRDKLELMQVFERGFNLAQSTLLKILSVGLPENWDELVLSDNN